jgi:hypothetical protein
MKLLNKIKNYVLYALLSVVLLLVVGCKDCKHSQTFNKVSDYQILYPYGIGSDFQNIYDYEIVDNCIKIKKGKVCFYCGEVIGFENEQICGTYQIRGFKYYR